MLILHNPTGEKWRGFPEPEKPKVSRDLAELDYQTHNISYDHDRWVDYDKAFVEAAKNSLPILNQEILDTMIDTIGFPGNRIIRLRKQNECFDWPGTYELKDIDLGESPVGFTGRTVGAIVFNKESQDLQIVPTPKGYVLTPPATVKEEESLSKLLEPIKTLAYRCLQWEHGEIKGYDSQMMDSLLPIIIQPLIQSLRSELEASKKENEQLKADNARYIAANSMLCDSESETKLANENNRLTIENEQLREALRELLPLAIFWDCQNKEKGDREIINKAKSLTKK